MKSLFITMEGVDGSGKTLQSKLLFDYLSNNNYDVILTREPGGTLISEKIRELIIDKNNDMIPLTEAFLYVAARSQIVSEIIKPALLERKIVICDRFVDSSIVYQGIARGIGIETIEIINSYATGGIKPDITFLFDINPRDSIKRKSILDSPDRIESEALAFHDRVYYGYHKLAKKYPDRIYVIDASLEPKTINNIVIDKLETILRG